MTDLRSGPQELRERAAKLLTASVAHQEASADGGAAGRCVRAGAVPALVALVTNGTDAGQASAAAALGCLATAGYHEEVARAGAIGPLVAVLRQSSQQAAAAAAGVLAGLSENASLHSAILQANVLPPLVRQLKAGLTEAKISAALTMASLASDSEEAQRTVLAAGAVPVLISMLPSGKAQVAAARALAFKV